MSFWSDPEPCPEVVQPAGVDDLVCADPSPPCGGDSKFHVLKVAGCMGIRSE